MKTVIIGDIHGCLPQLVKLLKKIEVDQRRDRLIFLGDYIDRGPYAYETIMYIIELQKAMGDRCIVLRGNHEEMMLEALQNHPASLNYCSLWEQNGGRETVASFKKNGTQIFSVKPWLQSLKYYYEIDTFICVHAGIDERGLKYTSEDTLLWDRSVAEDGWYQGKLLICGHTPVLEVNYQDGMHQMKVIDSRKKHPLPQTGVINLDTGCIFGYKLSAMVIEKHWFHVESVFWEDHAIVEE